MIYPGIVAARRAGTAVARGTGSSAMGTITGPTVVSQPVRVSGTNRTADFGRGSSTQTVAGTAIGSSYSACMNWSGFLVTAHTIGRITDHR